MLRATSVRSTYEVFQQYCHKIQERNTPKDPNYMRISIACGKVDQFIESVFPTQILKEEQKEPEESQPTTKETLFVIFLFATTLLLTTGLMVRSNEIFLFNATNRGYIGWNRLDAWCAF